jgi:hypothetical protein
LVPGAYGIDYAAGQRSASAHPQTGEILTKTLDMEAEAVA